MKRLKRPTVHRRQIQGCSIPEKLPYYRVRVIGTLWAEPSFPTFATMMNIYIYIFFFFDLCLLYSCRHTYLHIYIYIYIYIYTHTNTHTRITYTQRQQRRCPCGRGDSGKEGHQFHLGNRDEQPRPGIYSQIPNNILVSTAAVKTIGARALLRIKLIPKRECSMLHHSVVR